MLDDQEQLGAEWLRRKGVKSWDGTVGSRLAKWLSNRASGKALLKPFVPITHK